MAKIILCYNPYSDAATLSSGSWSLPLANVQNPSTGSIARSTNAANTSTRFLCTFGASRRVRAIYLRNCNITESAQVRIRGYAGPGQTNLVYDSTQFPVFPTSFNLQTPWSDPNFWGGASVSWDDPDRYPSILHVLPTQIEALVWYIEIFDAGNPDGYIQFDRLFIANYYIPTLNYTWGGNGLTFQDATVTEESIGGTEYFYRKVNKRIFRFSFDALPQNETYAAHYQMMTYLGGNREVLVIPNYEDFFNLLKRSFIGRLTSWNGITQVPTRLAQTGYEVRELL